MPINRLDHIAILTRDALASAEFYGFVLGLEPGPRPNFKVPGVWLYCDGNPLVHIVEVTEPPAANGSFDHVAFSGTDLASFVARLNARDVSYDLRHLPEGGSSGSAWQLFFRDPDGARVEIDFPASEPQPAASNGH
jgi:catechol 2,3-dioxygenase-like lactoylglutathione lyase family enzyme